MIELLIAMSMSLLLVSAVLKASAEFMSSAQMAADRAELAERAFYAAEMFGEVFAQVVSDEPMTESTLSDACVSLDGSHLVGIRLLGAADLPCLPAAPDLVGEGVVLEQRYESEAGCVSCDSVLERTVFFRRDYSWARGDGIGALMRASWLPEAGRFTRAEMLVPGVELLKFAPITQSDLICEDSQRCDRLIGIDVDFEVHSWVPVASPLAIGDGPLSSVALNESSVDAKHVSRARVSFSLVIPPSNSTWTMSSLP